MRNRLLFILLFLLVTSNCQRCQIKPERDTKPWQDVLAYAQKHLPMHGKLVQRNNGYVYLKVDDRYIHDLFPMLHAEGFHEPPYFRRDDAPGAHISVFYENEHIAPDEIGDEFNFALDEIVMVQLKKNLSYIVLRVNSPELEKLRVKYGLSKKLNNVEFHISIAKKER